MKTEVGKLGVWLCTRARGLLELAMLVVAASTICTGALEVSLVVTWCAPVGPVTHVLLVGPGVVACQTGLGPPKTL